MSAYHTKVTDSLVTLHTPVAACTFSRSFYLSFPAVPVIFLTILFTPHVSAGSVCFHIRYTLTSELE